MSVQENKELISRYVEEIYNQKNLDKFFEFADEGVDERGIDHLQQFYTAFPDSHTTVLDMFGEGDKVVLRMLIKATNKGSFAGQPPTGKKVEFISIRIFQIVDNRIVNTWAQQDQLGLLKQLGFARTVGDVNWATSFEK